MPVDDDFKYRIGETWLQAVAVRSRACGCRLLRLRPLPSLLL